MARRQTTRAPGRLSRTRALLVALVAVLALAGGVVAAPGESSQAASPPTVGVVGDSLLRQVEPNVRAAVGTTHRVVSYTATNGMRIAQMAPAAVAAATSPTGPDVLLIGLGANDLGQGRTPAQQEHDVRALLAAVAPHVSCVRWFDVKDTPTDWHVPFPQRARQLNRILVQVAEEFPNVEVMHHAAWAAAAGPTYFLGDGLHYSGAGRSEMGVLAHQAVVSCDPALTTGPFWDVPDSVPFAAEVAWMGDAGISNGFTNGAYRGVLGSLAVPVTRQAMAAFLHRLAGGEVDLPATPTFRDVTTAHPFYEAIEWMTASGVSTGYGDGTFRSVALVTRQAMAAFLHRLVGSDPPAPGAPTFDDVPVDHPFFADVEWMAANGVSTGYSNGTYRPSAVVSRFAMAAFLARTDQLL